jgi:transposase
MTQIRGDTAGKAYYQRKGQNGKSHLRCLKRRLADVVYRMKGTSSALQL